MLERFLIPLAPFVILALSLVAGLIFFTLLDREVRLLKSTTVRRGEIDLVVTQEFRLKLEDLNARLRDAEDRAGILPSPVSLKPSLNLNTRTQILRMSRRGEPSRSIAASLSIPRKEVELLLKVHELITNSSIEKTA